MNTVLPPRLAILSKLKTDSARFRILEIMDEKEIPEASQLLLKCYAPSSDFSKLERAAKIADKLGRADEHTRLLTRAAELAGAQGLANVFLYIGALKKLDHKAASRIFWDYARRKTSAMDDATRYYASVSFARAWREPKLVAKYKKLALEAFLKRKHLTDGEVLDIIWLMKEMGQTRRAQTFAREYVQELKDDDKNAVGPDEYTGRLLRYLGQLSEGYQNYLKILIEAGIAEGALNDVRWLLKNYRSSAKELLPYLDAIEYVAEHLNKKVPRELYLAAARKREANGNFLSARGCYAKAGRLDKKTSSRLATQEVKRIIAKIDTETPTEHLDVWNTMAYIGEHSKSSHSNRSDPVTPDLAYELGLTGDVEWIILWSKKIRSPNVKRKLLRQTAEKLKSIGRYGEAANVALILDGRNAAREFWARASAEYERAPEDDDDRRYRNIYAAMNLARLAGDKQRYKRLLIFFLGTLEKDQSAPVSWYETISEAISRGFYAINRSSCTRIIEKLNSQGSYVKLANLLVRLKIRDEEVLQKALEELESTGKYSDAKRLAQELGDETLGELYAFLEHPEVATKSELRSVLSQHAEIIRPKHS